MERELIIPQYANRKLYTQEDVNNIVEFMQPLMPKIESFATHLKYHDFYNDNLAPVDKLFLTPEKVENIKFVMCKN